MDKKEFEETDTPLAMLVSLDPKTGKVKYDAYHWDDVDFWIEEFERDFPDMLHFKKMNPAGREARRKVFGMKI